MQKLVFILIFISSFLYRPALNAAATSLIFQQHSNSAYTVVTNDNYISDAAVCVDNLQPVIDNNNDEQDVIAKAFIDASSLMTCFHFHHSVYQLTETIPPYFCPSRKFSVLYSVFRL